MYYIKSIYNPDKHPLIPDDFPWQISRNPIENGIEIEEADYRILEASFDLSAYEAATNPSQAEIEAGLEIKSTAYSGPGTIVADRIEKKVWARNTYLKSKGIELTAPEMNSLLQISIGIDKALRTGSLKTARDGLVQLKVVLPKYADIGDWAIATLGGFID